MDQKTGFGEQMPASIGRYQVQGSIGYGAMGAVYKAFDPLIKRTLAIKTIRLDIPRNSPQYKSFIERFYHEARISGTLSHPHIVTLFDIGEEQAIPYLAMEFVEGDTISSLLEKGVKFLPEKVISLVSQVASAIDYAHSKGVIHRDIKPSNMILSEDRLKVTDFGIAKLVDSEMTQAGQLLGTPSYMSPEQAMGDKLDGRSDIFSLGVCAFEMLSGEQPFPGTNVTSILYKLVHVDPIEPANLEMNGLVPQKWHEVFSKVLAKKPDDRYQTGAEFVQDLEYCLGSWFGGMGSESSSEMGATVAMPAVTGRAQTDVPPPSPPEITAAIARDELAALPEAPATIQPSAKIPSAVARPSVEVTASMPRVRVPAPDSPMTVQMKAPMHEDLKTAPMPVPAPAAPPLEEDYGTVAMKAPFVPTKRESPEATITLKAAASAASAPSPAPPRPEPPTLLPLPTIRQPAPVLDTPTLRAAPARAAASTPAPFPPPVAAPRPAAPASRSGVSPLLVLGLAAGFFFLAIAVAAIVWLRQRAGTAELPTPGARGRSDSGRDTPGCAAAAGRGHGLAAHRNGSAWSERRRQRRGARHVATRSDSLGRGQLRGPGGAAWLQPRFRDRDDRRRLADRPAEADARSHGAHARLGRDQLRPGRSRGHGRRQPGRSDADRGPEAQARRALASRS